MKWDHTLRIGIKTIDDQHKTLLDLTNEVEKLFRAAFEGEGTYDDAIHVLVKLNLYAMKHFDAEEKLLKEAGYPLFEAHKAEHDAFTQYVQKVSTQRLEEAPEEVLLELFSYLSNWIIDHIREKDFKYKKFINGEWE